MKILKHLVLILLIGLLAACASTDDEPAEDLPEEQLYEDAQRYMDSKNYDLAVRRLQLLETRYPFGRYAEQAQLEIIYAYYESSDHGAAIESAERFIRLHPQHPNVDYAYYLKGLATYADGKGLLDNILPLDQTQRDSSSAQRAFSDFAQLLSRFPDSRYAADAKVRMVSLRNLIARHEINVANYYFKRGAYLAAANRGRYVVENFQQTPAVGDGLAVMVQAYQLLDMHDLAKDALSVLRSNYPKHYTLNEKGRFISKFSTESREESWLEKLTFGVFGKPAAPIFDSRTANNP